MEPKQQVLMLRIVVAFLAALAVVTQVIIVPAVASSYAARYPEVAELAPLYVVLLVGVLAACEMGLLATWMIANGALRGQIAAGSYKPWSVILLVAGVVAGVLLMVLFGHAMFIALVGGPPMLFGFIASAVFSSLWFLGCRQIIAYMQDEIQGVAMPYLEPVNAQ
ncbi:hypothetical protein [Jonesia quinghaiensis]|uniref:hypothetical protein n=1 Tax=Jonesia quinghaiensis TaxID=262806 RepID=UPI00048DB711|nr:hypothetical protein [Jonesia quinghaiensis]